MQRVYTGRTAGDAHGCASWLRGHGVEAELRGEPLWQPQEPQLSKKPKRTTVWVSEADGPRAAELVRGWIDQGAGDEAESPCPACGEPGPDRFDVCWHCGASRRGQPASGTTVADAGAVADAASVGGPAPGMSERAAFPSNAHETSGDDRNGRADAGSSESCGADAGSVGHGSSCHGGARSPWSPTAHEPVSVLTFPWGMLLVTVACALVWHGLSHDPHPNSDPAMEHWGWRSAHDVWGGAWWSFLAASFVHADWEHFFGNLCWLWVFGLRLEQALRPGRWLLFVAAAGFVSGAIDQAWLGEHSYGASGLLYAAFGAFLVAGIPRRLVPWWVHIPLCVYFICDAVVYDLRDVYDEMLGREILDPVANVAHLSGFAAGCLLGLLMVGGRARIMGIVGSVLLGLTAFVPLVWAPWSLGWCLDRGDVAKKQHRPEAALAWYDRAIRMRPDDAGGWLARGQFHLERNSFEAALADANRAVAIEKAALERAALQQAERAISDEGVATLPDSTEAAVSPKAKGDDRTATDKAMPDRNLADRPAPQEGDGRRTVENDPSVDRAAPRPSSEPRKSNLITGASFQLRGQIHGVLCRYAEADDDLSWSLRIDPDAAFPRVLRAIVRWEQSRHAEALEDLSLAHDAAPSDAWIRLVRGAVLREAGEGLAARDELERVIEAYHPLAEGDAPDPFALSWLAWAHDELGEPESAEDYATRALEKSPDDWDMLARRAHARVQLGKSKEALDDAEASLRINGRNVFAQCVKGQSLGALGRHDEALAEYGRAIEINPRYLRAFVGRAAERRNAGDRKGALDDLNRALDLNPRCAAAFLERSRVYRDLRDRRRALADRQTAEAIDPSLRSLRPSDSGDEPADE